jgi:hypothetical protein
VTSRVCRCIAARARGKEADGQSRDRCSSDRAPPAIAVRTQALRLRAPAIALASRDRPIEALLRSLLGEARRALVDGQCRCASARHRPRIDQSSASSPGASA